MRIGQRLRWLDDPGQDFNLGDLLDLVEHADPSMAIYRVLNPDYQWGLPEQLLAALFDRAQMDAWGQGGGKGPRPKQIPRPGVTEKQQRQWKPKRKMSITDMDAWLKTRQRGA